MMMEYRCRTYRGARYDDALIDEPIVEQLIDISVSAGDRYIYQCARRREVIDQAEDRKMKDPFYREFKQREESSLF